MIDTPDDLLGLIESLRGVKEIALDCEFHREKVYHPQLCLVQIGWEGGAVAIDPFGVDLGPIGPLLADPSIVKLFHSGENDIPLLVTATGASIANVFDTQIAAPFVGHSAVPSYGALVERLLGIEVSKDMRFTDWSVRPLGDEQLEYALDDVRHLPALAAALRQSLAELNRLEWAQSATEEMVDRVLAPRDRSKLYLRIKRPNRMSQRQLAVLRELANWRDERASRVNRPVNWVVPDETLVQLARRPPRSADEIGSQRGLGGLGRGVDGLLAAVRRGIELPKEELPEIPEAVDSDTRVDLVTQLLSTALRVKAGELQISPSVIADRKTLSQLAAWYFNGRTQPKPEIISGAGWKSLAVGELLMAVLEGRCAIKVDAKAPDGVTIVEGSG